MATSIAETVRVASPDLVEYVPNVRKVCRDAYLGFKRSQRSVELVYPQDHRTYQQRGLLFNYAAPHESQFGSRFFVTDSAAYLVVGYQFKEMPQAPKGPSQTVVGMNTKGELYVIYPATSRSDSGEVVLSMPSPKTSAIYNHYRPLDDEDLQSPHWATFGQDFMARLTEAA